MISNSRPLRDVLLCGRPMPDCPGKGKPGRFCRATGPIKDEKMIRTFNPFFKGRLVPGAEP